MPIAMQTETSPKSQPEVLVTAEELGGKQRAYLQFRDVPRKDAFREELLSELFGSDQESRDQFLALCEQIETDGIAIIDRFIDKESVSKMVSSYEAMMEGEASNKSSIHHYVDLKKHPEFVFDPDYNDLFFHPLTVAAISYLNGGPVIINDARAKDAPPSNTREQDNSLHFDNKPFFDELKINISFEKGTGNGPSGQNFVTIPGINQFYRNSDESPEGDIFSREKFSVIDTQEMVDEVLEKQRGLRGKMEVCEVKGTEGPALALFKSSRIVHQRYRTLEDGSTRSGIILAFQDARYFENLPEMPDIPDGARDSVAGFLLAGPQHRADMDAEFLGALRADRERITEKLHTLQDEGQKQPDQPVLHSISEFAMDSARFDKWYEDAIHVKTVQDTKDKLGLTILEQNGDRKTFSAALLKMMVLDKMANLDLRLYPDYRDEVRKPQRAKARETSRGQLAQLIDQYLPDDYPALQNTPNVLDSQNVCGIIQKYAEKLERTEAEIQNQPDSEALGQLSSDCRSLKQLLIDLDDQICHCDTDQRKITASLFVFLTVASNINQIDADCQRAGLPPFINQEEAYEADCRQLLGNYISVLMTVEKSRATSEIISFAERYPSKTGNNPDHLWADRATKRGNGQGPSLH